ncbi:MAG: OadG family protein [Anaerolineales bacterium]|nr:OadG family protein [Anaerolineales bacterium]
MTENLLIALEISLIGMGLVFGAILMLWGLITVLVRLMALWVQSEIRPGTTAVAERLLKQRAAAAAVSVALAIRSDEDQPHEFPLPPTAQVSPWQAVMRSNILNKQGKRR